VNLVGDFYKLLAFLHAERIDVDTPEGSARFGALARFSEVLADFEHVHRRGRTEEDGRERVFRGAQDRGKPYLQALARYLVFYAFDAYEEFEGSRRRISTQCRFSRSTRRRGWSGRWSSCPRWSSHDSLPAARGSRRSGRFRSRSFRRRSGRATRGAKRRSAGSSTSL